MIKLTGSLGMAVACWFVMASTNLPAAERIARSTVEFHRFAREARPGDTIILADGEWRDADLLFSAVGAASQPVKLVAQTPGKVHLTGASRLRIAGEHLVVSGLFFQQGGSQEDVVSFRANSMRHANHCRLTQCAILDYCPADRMQESKWISLYGRHNRVDHCLLQGKTNAGATVVVWLSDQPNEHLLDHNYFGPRPKLGVNGGETIRIGDSKSSHVNSRTRVETNLFESCNGEVEIISSKSCENILHGNTFLACEGALTLRHGNRAVVSSNFFLGKRLPRTGGVRVMGDDHRIYNNYFADLSGDGARSALTLMNGLADSPPEGHHQVRRASIAFNTFVNCRCSLFAGLRDEKQASLTPTDCSLANNLFFTSRGDALIQFAEPVPGITWDGNISRGELGISRPKGIRELDPLLAAGHDGLHRPSPTSPARGTAVGDFAWISDDLDGQPRAGKFDVGCDQFSAAEIVRRPLTRADVGPSWEVSPRTAGRATTPRP